MFYSCSFIRAKKYLSASWLRATTLFLTTLFRLSYSNGTPLLKYPSLAFGSHLTSNRSKDAFCLAVSIYSDSSFDDLSSSVISFTKKKISAFLTTSIFKTEVTNCYHIHHLLSCLISKSNFRWSGQSNHLYILSHAILKTNVYAHFLLNSCLNSLKKTCQDPPLFFTPRKWCFSLEAERLTF